MKWKSLLLAGALLAGIPALAAAREGLQDDGTCIATDPRGSCFRISDDPDDPGTRLLAAITAQYQGSLRFTCKLTRGHIVFVEDVAWLALVACDRPGLPLMYGESVAYGRDGKYLRRVGGPAQEYDAISQSRRVINALRDWPAVGKSMEAAR